jgi:hypothetical protein
MPRAAPGELAGDLRQVRRLPRVHVRVSQGERAGGNFGPEGPPGSFSILASISKQNVPVSQNKMFQRRYQVYLSDTRMGCILRDKRLIFVHWLTKRRAAPNEEEVRCDGRTDDASRP